MKQLTYVPKASVDSIQEQYVNVLERYQRDFPVAAKPDENNIWGAIYVLDDDPSKSKHRTEELFCIALLTAMTYEGQEWHYAAGVIASWIMLWRNESQEVLIAELKEQKITVDMILHIAA